MAADLPLLQNARTKLHQQAGCNTAAVFAPPFIFQSNGICLSSGIAGVITGMRCARTQPRHSQETPQRRIPVVPVQNRDELQNVESWVGVESQLPQRLPVLRISASFIPVLRRVVHDRDALAHQNIRQRVSVQSLVLLHVPEPLVVVIIHEQAKHRCVQKLRGLLSFAVRDERHWLLIVEDVPECEVHGVGKQRLDAVPLIVRHFLDAAIEVLAHREATSGSGELSPERLAEEVRSKD